MHSPAHLSKCLMRAYACYSDLEVIVDEILAHNEYSVDQKEMMEDILDDVVFYMNEIVEHSTPAHWTDAELEWIEGVRGDLASAEISE